VTADDDILYPRYWLKGLVEAFRDSSEVINCYRARVIALNESRMGNYEGWEFASSGTASYRHFATGVGGVIYPPEFQRALKAEGSAFEQCCPTADDIWLHVQALRCGYKVRQVRERPIRLVVIPGTQAGALLHLNQAGEGNDRQIACTYKALDIVRLREDK